MARPVAVAIQIAECNSATMATIAETTRVEAITMVGGDSYQYQGYRGYGYPAYAPAASATPAPTMNTSYPPQPAAKSQPESTSPKDK